MTFHFNYGHTHTQCACTLYSKCIRTHLDAAQVALIYVAHLHTQRCVFTPSAMAHFAKLPISADLKPLVHRFAVIKHARPEICAHKLSCKMPFYHTQAVSGHYNKRDVCRKLRVHCVYPVIYNNFTRASQICCVFCTIRLCVVDPVGDAVLHSFCGGVVNS